MSVRLLTKMSVLCEVNAAGIEGRVQGRVDMFAVSCSRKWCHCAVSVVQLSRSHFSEILNVILRCTAAPAAMSQEASRLWVPSSRP